jgi:hypothetical protein
VDVSFAWVIGPAATPFAGDLATAQLPPIATVLVAPLEHDLLRSVVAADHYDGIIARW